MKLVARLRSALPVSARTLASVVALGSTALVTPGCGADDDGAAAPAAAPAAPVLTTGGCGLEPYSLVATAGLGRVVEWEALPGLSFSATLIDSLLAEQEIEGFSPVPYGARVYRIRYVTQDKGEEIETTALVSFPDTDEPIEVPSILWTHGTSGFSDACAPSRAGAEGAIFNILFSALGFAVASPDYLGMNGFGAPSGRLHPYLVPEATAFASLDALRALHRFRDGEGDPELAPKPQRRTIFWGGSEGGFAALWADRYAKGYAPEIDVLATVALVPPTDLLGLAVHGVSHVEPATAGLAAAFVAMHDWYGGPDPLSSVLTDVEPTRFATKLPQLMRTECGGGEQFEAVTQVKEVFQAPFVASVKSGEWDELNPWTCYLRMATLRETKIERGHDAPVLFVVSEKDDLVVAEVERADVPRLCEAGYGIEYLECAGAGHTEGATTSLPYQWDWVRARLDGKPLDAALVCQVRPAVPCGQ